MSATQEQAMSDNGRAFWAAVWKARTVRIPINAGALARMLSQRAARTRSKP